MELWMGISENCIGICIWVLWAMIGLFEALLASRFTPGRRVWADVVAGLVAGAAGGYFSIHFPGDSPIQRLLISILGAVFLSAVVLWIVGKIIDR